MQTTTGISSLQMELSEHPIISSNRELLGSMVRKAQKTDWDLVIAKVDKQISRAGAVAIAFSGLYFAYIFVSMALR